VPTDTKQDPFLVWQTADIPIYFTKNGEEGDEYAIIQAVRKPATAKYIGFGEQGGHNLSKNGRQVNFFNYDNIKARQVYNQGPLDSREPLYHSDPIFFEFNGVPSHDSVTALYVNNPAQTLMDMGFENSERYMVGTRFGDLDYFFFME
jgi:alpha-glucosidase